MTLHAAETGLESVEEKITEARDALEAIDWDEDVDVDTIALSTLVALHELTGVVHALREAGATIESVPVEEEAMVTCLANARLIHQDMKADIAHLEQVVGRVR